MPSQRSALSVLQSIRTGIKEGLKNDSASVANGSSSGDRIEPLLGIIASILEELDDYEKTRPTLVSPVNAQGPDEVGAAHHRADAPFKRGDTGDRSNPRAGVHRRFVTPWDDGDPPPGDHELHDTRDFGERDTEHGERGDVRS